jgi:hypothetical protein
VYVAKFAGPELAVPERIRFTTGEVAPVVSLAWSIVGLADTDGDGVDDVIWRGPNGSVEHWRMQDRAILRYGMIWESTGEYWSIAAFPDFSGTGRRGVLFRGGAGETWKWDLDGTDIIDSRPLRTVDPAWRTVEMHD